MSDVEVTWLSPLLKSPRVTVVIIVRDGERFLEEALHSVCAQTMTDWEVVVVDDGSRDATREIALRFVDRNATRFRLLQHEFGACHGMSASRNLGIQHARGIDITFLDHDDTMLPNKLERQCALLDRHPRAAAVIGPNVRWYSWNESRSGDDTMAREDEVQDLGVRTKPEGTLLHPPSLLSVFLVRTDATPQAPMVRRNAILAVQGFEDEFCDMYEDQVFLAKLLIAQPVVVSEEVWQRYRQHHDSCVRRSHRERRQQRARRRYLSWLGVYLRKRSTEYESDAVQSAMLRTLVAAVRREWWKSIGASFRSTLRVRRVRRRVLRRAP